MVKHNEKVVCIGGGTGLSTMLRGIKAYTEDLVAIVTVTDNGGHSGVLRAEMNMLPPGDIRNCLMALAETEPIMNALFQHRFKEGSLKGHNFGNLFIAALTELYGSFEKAVEKTNEILAVKGQVLPVTLANVHLCAEHYDGTMSYGEIEVVARTKQEHNPIRQVFFDQDLVPANEKALQALLDADVIILGPGSLYTSIIPNLLVSGVKEAIAVSKAKVFYVSNIMTQPGETDAFSLSMHIREIERYLGVGIIDYVVMNDAPVEERLLKLYEADGAEMVDVDYDHLTDYHLLGDDLISVIIQTPVGVVIRHNPKLLAQLILNQGSG